MKYPATPNRPAATPPSTTVFVRMVKPLGWMCATPPTPFAPAARKSGPDLSGEFYCLLSGLPHVSRRTEISAPLPRPSLRGRRPGAMWRGTQSSVVGGHVLILKVIKYGVLTVAGGALITSLLLGSEAMSYVRSSARSVRTAVKDNIPIEFELRRARDLLDDILPEMQANVRLMAQQEVEIDAAKEDIEGCQKSLSEEGVRVQKLRDMVSTGPSTQTLG